MLAKKPINLPPIVSVELIQITDKTNIPFAPKAKKTIEEQKKLYATGASKTMRSKHLDGEAVDLVAYMNGNVSWELSVYDEIATAMSLAARELDLAIRWGAAWHIPDIRYWEKSFEEAYTDYIDLRRSEGKVPFIDAPHFEINR